MYRVAFKLLFFVAVIMAVTAANRYIQDGPLVQHNTELSMNQFNGTPATAGDISIAGYWIPFGVVYVAEALVITMLGFTLFVRGVARTLAGRPQKEKS